MNETYIVKRGDTLYGISNQFGVSVTDLKKINNLSSNTLQIGQTIVIPKNQGTNPNSTFIYTVKKGDSLYSIAKMYDTTVQKIIDLNNLRSTSLSIGQKLTLPENYPTGDIVLPNYINYTVKKGDNLYSIARTYNVSVDTIMKDNNLNTNTLSVGQNLKIRISKESMEEVEECFGEDYTPPSSTSTVNYTVKKGDSLYKIAASCGTSVSEIMNLNNLKSTALSIGQELKIPTSNSDANTTYTVKNGDNLYSIARKFNTSVDSIKRKNNLSSNLLSIGQKLII